MRLGQISRKLNVKPNDIRDFIESEFKVRIELDLNFKLDDNQIAALNENFKQVEASTNVEEEEAEQVEEITNGDEVATEEATIVNEIEPVLDEIKEEVKEEVANPEESQQDENERIVADPFEPLPVNPDAELIKAPKIKLEGLKVVGKIELPEKYKKVEETTAEDTEIPTDMAAASEGESELKKIDEKAILEPVAEEEYSIYKDKKGIYHFSQQQRENRKKSLERIALKKLEKQKRKNKAKHYEKIAAVAKKESPEKKKAKKENKRQKSVVVKPVRKGIWGKFLNWLND